MKLSMPDFFIKERLELILIHAGKIKFRMQQVPSSDYLYHNNSVGSKWKLSFLRILSIKYFASITTNYFNKTE
jgi:hypothetical protein